MGLSREERSDPNKVRAIIDSIFRGIPASEKRACLEFLAASIESIPSKYQDRWGVSLFNWGIRLNVGWVNVLVLGGDGLSVLLSKRAAPPGTPFNGSGYKNAPGCEMATVPLPDLVQVLPSLDTSHREAVAIAAERWTHETIRQAHSPGVIKFLSDVLRRSISNPCYAIPAPLHLLNGGYGNGDKELLEQLAGRHGHAKLWVVPKSAAVGDDAVINVAEFGLFATAKIASHTRPHPDPYWKARNRYGADLEDIRLITPPIPLAEVQRRIPDLGWARYARSIATPSPENAKRIRGLLLTETMKDENDLDLASPSEIMSIASLDTPRIAAKAQRVANQRIRSARVRKLVLERADGLCEGCEKPAPFMDNHGLPFLETHHTIRAAEDGPDDRRYVIALCPNCHRRTDYGEDAKSFNNSLIQRLAKLYPQNRNTRHKGPF